MMAVKRSVVGSGPILCPGKSRFSSDRMKEVLPTEYYSRQGDRETWGEREEEGRERRERDKRRRHDNTHTVHACICYTRGHQAAKYTTDACIVRTLLQLVIRSFANIYHLSQHQHYGLSLEITRGQGWGAELREFRSFFQRQHLQKMS
jgi:hypothetical protein